MISSEWQVIISGHFDKKVRLWDNRSSSSEPMNELVVGGKVNMNDYGSHDYDYERQDYDYGRQG